jgi:hypothetical protein
LSLLRARAPVVGFLLALVVYGAALREINPVADGDEPHYALEAISVARDGDRDMRNQYADPRLAAAVSRQPLLPQARDYGSGHLVSLHGIGLAVLLAPVAAFTDHLTWMRIEMLVLTALAAALLLRLVLRFDSSWRGWAAWALSTFSLPVVAFSNQLYPEVPGGLCVLLGLGGVLAGTRARLEWFAALAATAALPWLHVRFLPIAAGLALALGVRAWRDGAARRWALPAVVLALVVSLGAMSYEFHRWYGSALPTAVFTSERATPPVRPARNVRHRQAGDRRASQYLTDTVTHVSGPIIYRGGVSRWLSPGTGWLPFAPVALLALAGLVPLARRRPWWLATGAVVTGGYLVLLAILSSGIGSAFPGRFLVAVAPLLAVPLAAALAVPGAVVAAAALGALGLLYTAVGVTHANRLYSSGPDRAVSLPVFDATSGLWPRAGVHRTVDVAHSVALPAGRASPVVALGSGDYAAAFALARSAGPAPGPLVLRVVRADGAGVTSLPVQSGEVPSQRTFLLPFRATGAVGVRLEASGASDLAVQRAQIAGTELARAPAPDYRDWPRTLAWLLIIGSAALYLFLRDPARARPG